VETVTKWQLYGDSHKVVAVWIQSQNGYCVETVTKWLLYGDSHKVVAVWIQSQNGNCMETVTKWLLDRAVNIFVCK